MNNFEHPLFTVVIPNYKRVEELKRALQSIIDQKNFEELVDKIIIVDDKSENVKLIDDTISLLNNNKILHIKNNFKSNAAYTRNQGAKCAKTEWVCFLDSDDSFAADKLIKLAHEIVENNHSNKTVFINQAVVYFNKEIEDIVPHRAIGEKEHISDYLFVSDEYMQTSTLTIHSSFFERFGFNEEYVRHQDYDLCLTLYENGYTFKQLDFVGTNIYWGTHERPISKGESVNYSLKWITENKGRVTECAYNNFMFKFVVMKCLRGGGKLHSLQYISNVKLNYISYKYKMYFLILFFTPGFLYFYLYNSFKKRKINARKKNKSLIVANSENNY
ncbi:TPA: glycosyltransferase family 2 protein [Escherichia coli]